MLDHFEKFESYIPFDLLQLSNILVAILVMYVVIILRYFMLVGVFHWFFWYRKSENQLYQKSANKKQIFFEIKWSLISSWFFSLAGIMIGIFWQKGWAPIYLKLDHYGLWYLPLSFILIALLHEVYFYFTHRLLHIPYIYKKAHQVHHFSVNPSAWASLSFHPFEALLEALVLPLILLIIPTHPLVILNYLLFMTISAIINHLGVEVFVGKLKVLRKYFISGTHHHQHHSKFNYNFGLYFTFMDSLMGTDYKGKKHT